MKKHLILIETAAVLLLTACGSGEAADGAAVSSDATPATAAGAPEANATPSPAPDLTRALGTDPLTAPVAVTGEMLPLPQPTGERQIGVRLSEFQIEMTRTEIPAGEYEFHVVNAGKVEHDFVVRSESVYALTEHLEPGDSTILRVELPPGEHRFLCGIRDDRDHHASGMDGFILVR